MNEVRLKHNNFAVAFVDEENHKNNNLDNRPLHPDW